MMAWQLAFILSTGVAHLRGTNKAKERELVERYKRFLFPELRTSVGQTVWKTYCNITRATIWG